MITYAIKQADPTVAVDDVIIEKSGTVHEFTVSSLRDDLKRLEKVTTEITAQKGLESAKMENIKHFHPFVLDFTEEQLNAIQLYAQALGVYNACEKKLKEVAEAQAEYANEVVEIEKQTGVKI